MKYILYLVTVFLFMGCNLSQKDEDILSVSIEPQAFFLKEIAGDKFEINTAIPIGSNPEVYDPSPSQMVDISKSKLYFKIGNLGFENTWLHNIEVNSPAMKIIDCSVGLNLIEGDHENCNEHGHNHHTGVDPHIWSSPKTASVVAKNIYNALIEFDDKNKSYYLENYQELEKSISQTDSIVKSYIEQAPSKSFIIYHPALTYFAEEYGLNQLCIEIDGKTPAPTHLSELIEKGKKENVKVIFVQAEFDEKNAITIAKEIGADVVRINPLSYNWHDEMIKIAKAIAQK